MNNQYPYLITVDYPPETGGVARYLFELQKASQGDLRVIVPLGQGMGGEGVIAKQLFRSKWPRWWPVVGVCLSLKKNARALLISHVLPIGTAAMIARLFGGPKYILLLHGLDIRLANRTFWKRLLFRCITFFASSIVLNSDATKKLYSSYSSLNTSIDVIRPAVSDHVFLSKEEARLRLGIQENEYIILAVARLVARKGIDTLIESMKFLPEHDRVRVVVIGDGPESAALHELARASSHPVTFISYASDEHKFEWYSAANVFCLPVKDFSDDLEGFGIVFLEAALAGLPVIAGKSGGVSEAVLDRETGVLVSGSDPKEVARALMILLGDKELQQKYGQAGRDRVLKHFRWSDRWEAYKRIFDRL